MPQHPSPPACQVHPDWLAISTEGFASMNAGRPPAHLVKELVQNSLDALGDKHGHILLSFEPSSGSASGGNSGGGGGGEAILVTCRDTGCGMADLHDLRTVFFTSKVDSHLERGRMGRGFKEMLCLARWATVVSGPRKVEFVIEGGKRITRHSAVTGRDAVAGTLVRMEIPWPKDVIPQLEAYFRTLLPPPEVQLVVNGTRITFREPAHRVEAALPTELFEAGKWIRPVRKTVLELVPTVGGEEATIYELGIPVCPLEWGTQPYHVNVLQRVPMNPCRDAVASGYLVKVHKACLPALLPQMDSQAVLQDWVGQAVPHCPADVQQEVIKRGFGEQVVRSVPKMGARQFDEDARDLGLHVIDARQTSGGFRQLLQDLVPTSKQAVDQHHQNLLAAAASSSFRVEDAYQREDRPNQQRRQLIEAVGGKERVQQVMDFERWFCQQLLDGYPDPSVCSVTLALLKPVDAVATWSSADVLTLGIDTPGIWIDPFDEDSLTTLIHEVSHCLNAHHGRDFHQELEKLAGRAARVMLLHANEIQQRWPDLTSSPSRQA